MQGSIPWVGVGSVAFFLVILTLLRLVGLNLSVRASSVKEEETPMKKHRLVPLSCSTLETFWAIGASFTAGALPA
jgi:hypothetical protein